MFGKKRLRKRSRLSGHSLSGGSYGRGRSRNLDNYDPNQDLADSISSPYKQALSSGTGLAKVRKKDSAPRNLHGRSSFRPEEDRFGGNQTGSFTSKGERGKFWSKNPRAFIKF